jgi:protein-L-isoaspartate(D-aspartate) O-methyltransferase
MRTFEDTYRHKGLRRQMVDIIRKKGITNEKILASILQVPRHYFLDAGFDSIAYEDRALPIAEGQTISQPYTVAYQTQLLDPKSHEKVLEVGTGSAYQASILAEMGVQVFSIERQRKLFESNKLLPILKKYPGLKMFYGDGYEGLPTFAPFDKVLVTAAAPFIPTKLIEQLKIGGWMVVPVGEGGIQQMVRVTKYGDSSYKEETFDNFSFVPMTPGKRN